MDAELDSWVALLTAGITLNVVGLLFMETMAWYVQYAALGLSLVLVSIAAHRALSDGTLSVELQTE